MKRLCKICLMIVMPLAMLTLDASYPSATDAASAPKVHEVTFTAVDYSFSGPNNVPAGMITLRIDNKGKELHQIQITRLTEGKTADDLQAVLKTDPMAMNLPGWVQYFGGPNAAVPGESSTATVNLKPGKYLLTCLVTDQKGVAHITRGMLRPLTVTEAPESASATIKADRVIELTDFAFTVDRPLMAGQQTIEVVNKGAQAHEVVLVQLPPNVTIQDFGNYFLPEAPQAGGPPPGKPLGGVSGIGKGGRAYFTTNLTPGRYGLICFFPEAGKFHFVKGMIKEFEVK